MDDMGGLKVLPNDSNLAIIDFILQVKIIAKIAICSQNCVQIWKGRDRKMDFCMVRHKIMSSQRRDCSYIKLF